MFNENILKEQMSERKTYKMCRKQNLCENRSTCTFWHPIAPVCNYGKECRERDGVNPKCKRAHFKKTNGLLEIDGKLVRPAEFNKVHHQQQHEYVPRKKYTDLIKDYDSAETDEDAKRIVDLLKKEVDLRKAAINECMRVINDYENYAEREKVDIVDEEKSDPEVKPEVKLEVKPDVKSDKPDKKDKSPKLSDPTEPKKWSDIVEAE